MARVNAYVGQTRSYKLIEWLRTEGIGECCQPREFPPKRLPWMFDNGAFAAWKAHEPFDAAAWLYALRSIPDGVGQPPDFAVAPDIVAGGLDSLAMSTAWLEQLQLARIPAYLAVQDGMDHESVTRALKRGFAGVFVGGTLNWKLDTGYAWVALAHRLGLPCHIGRVGTAQRVEWAAEIGADSIDSCLPLWSAENMAKFVSALRRAHDRSQLTLFVRHDNPPECATDVLYGRD